MKTIYIPEGQSVSYENLTIDRLVVDGYVHVSGELTVKHVSGHGTLSAGDVSANSIRVDELEAGVVYCNRLAARRVDAADVYARRYVHATECLSANFVEAKHLAMTSGDIYKVTAGEAVFLTPKRRSLFRFRLAAGLRSLWLKLTAPWGGGHVVVDADFELADERENDDGVVGTELYIVHLETGKEQRPAA